ncbi:TPA: hypothetical protein ACPWZ0_003125 [Salmonella enterica subsp. enterica serovar Vietnam]|nr:hypothetical protein [Salmonella enterica]HAU3220411.1 hypothetical protein [Salmonella enterica subsp. indica]
MAIFISPEHKIILDAHLHIPVIQAIAQRAFSSVRCEPLAMNGIRQRGDPAVISAKMTSFQAVTIIGKNTRSFYTSALSFSLPDYFQMLKIILW